MKFIVKPGKMAFHNNRRWREGEIVEIASIKEAKDPKKWPQWGVPADSPSANEVRETIAKRLVASRGKTFAPDAAARAEALLALNDTQA